MKKNFLLLLSLLFVSVYNFGQTQTFPVSFSMPELTNDIDIVVLPAPDVKKLLAEDAENIKNGTVERVGVALPCNLNMENAGHWDYFDDGSKLWRLQIIADNAIALSVDMKNFYLPKHSKLFIYSEDRSHVLGEFDFDDNIDNRFFSSDLVKGSSIILEYFEQANSPGNPSFEIIDVAYIYKNTNYFNNQKDFGDSDVCEVNISCPEGDNWQDQKRGVARILLKVGTNYGWCTGSMINNQRSDCTPYFLTADHCGEGASATDLSAWKFYFDYEADSCTSTANPSYNYTWGCQLIANGGNGGSTGSDFFLIKLNRTVYDSPWNIYYNGWDRSTTASGGGVSIHHPAGDIKKISTYTSTPVTSQWNYNGLASHWKVYWSSTVTNYGVTEGGSSGSPLFNSSGRIIGDLTGGGSYCTATYFPDYYGKFSYSWESNGTTSDKQLKPWLDPDNTGITTLDGIYYSDCVTSKNNQDIIKDLNVEVYPNPTQGEITILLDENVVQPNVLIEIYDMMGEMVRQKSVSIINNEVKFDFGDLTKGVYLINISVNDKKYRERVIFVK